MLCFCASLSACSMSSIPESEPSESMNAGPCYSLFFILSLLSFLFLLLFLLVLLLLLFSPSSTSLPAYLPIHRKSTNHIIMMAGEFILIRRKKDVFSATLLAAVCCRCTAGAASPAIGRCLLSSLLLDSVQYKRDKTHGFVHRFPSLLIFQPAF